MGDGTRWRYASWHEIQAKVWFNIQQLAERDLGLFTRPKSDSADAGIA